MIGPATWLAIVIIGSPGIVYLLRLVMRGDTQNPWKYGLALFLFVFPIYCGMGEELAQLFVGAAIALILLLLQFPMVFVHIPRAMGIGIARLTRHVWFLLKSR